MQVARTTVQEIYGSDRKSWQKRWWKGFCSTSYDVEDGRVVSSEAAGTNGSGHGALAGVLTALKADALICGGIGGGTQVDLAVSGIQLYGGVSGEADCAVQALLKGELNFHSDACCDHHHGAEHTYREHGCGTHTCGN